MALLTFGGYPSALPATADRLRRGADFWYDPLSGKRGSRVCYWLPRADVGAMLQWVGGQVQTFASVWGSIARVVRMQCPDDSGQYAIRAQVEWAGNSHDTDQFSGAYVTVDFATPDYDVAGDTPYASIRRSSSAEAITIPGRYLRVSGSGDRLNQDQHLPVPGVAYLLTLYQVQDVNDGAIAAALAAPVNSTTLYLPGLTVPAGYAFFETLDDDIEVSLGGVSTRNVTFKFRVRRRLKWNEILHKGVISTVLQDNGDYLHTTSDLNAIFA